MKKDLLKKELGEGILFEVKEAEKTDISLWRECFSDEEEDIKKAISSLSSCSFCASLSVNGKTGAQFIGVESRICEKTGIYIYALCTKKEFRGKGYMRLLLEKSFEYAKSLGYDLLWLFPANEELEGTYKRLGFSVPVYVGASPVLNSDEDYFLLLKAPVEFIAFDGDYEKLYELSSKIFPLDAFRYALESIAPSVSISYIINDGKCDGYIISKKDSKRLLAISESHRNLINYDKRSFAYIMPISELPSFDILAEPLLR